MPDVRRRAAALVVTAVFAALLPTMAPAAGTSAASTGGPRRVTGTFFWANAWAAHHTAAPGGAAPGAERMRRLVRLVERDDVALGAIAEIERSQIRAFRRSAPTYLMLAGGRGTTDSVFWDTRRYELVRGYRFRGLTYRGRRAQVPVAVLRDRASAHLSAVIAVHNPRDRWNARAYARDMDQVRRLRRTYGRISIFVAGDFNSGAWVACRAHRTRLFSAGHRRCDGSAPIDQLLVDHHVRISAYRRMDGPRVERITDHPALYRARFTIPLP